MKTLQITNSCICHSSDTILEGTNQLVSESSTSSPKTIPLLHIHPIRFYSFIFIIQKNFRQVGQYFNQGIALTPGQTPISTQPRQAWLHIHPRLQARFLFCPLLLYTWIKSLLSVIDDILSTCIHIFLLINITHFDSQI